MCIINHIIVYITGGVAGIKSMAVPDLDQSVASVARYHLSSGSTSSVVSISGDYCDSSGKVIKRYYHTGMYCVLIHALVQRCSTCTCWSLEIF